MNDRYYIGTTTQPPPPDAAHFRTSALSREPAGPSGTGGAGGALCVEMGFYEDISWESRCNIKINV